MSKKLRTKLLIVLMGGLALAGCASGTKFRDFPPATAAIAPQMGRILFYRLISATGSSVAPLVKLNGSTVGQSALGCFFLVERKPGDYEVLISTEVSRKLTFTLEAGQTRYVRQTPSMGILMDHVYPELVDPEVGLKEIQDCRFNPEVPFEE